MFKMGIRTLFVTFTEHIAVSIWSVYYWNFKLLNSGVEGTPFTVIPLQVITILIIEYLISVILIIIGIIQLLKKEKKTYEKKL
ncbi:hypothetical protein [Ruminiclostridium cellobioparum]|jgi:hypothetical protein|uniref:hypothetical protein n=1 Tax=Ruminiclostridium cellobioparum TaxID=29355 RepID=UPI0028AE7983|nr:hypothetical protein [Ruminiclostridium cellobioparum]